MKTKNLDILVVEDKKIHQESAKLLGKEGHNVDLAIDFVDAVNYMGSKGVARYDAVLTDMMLPFGGSRGEIVCFKHDCERYEENPLGYAIALYAARQKVPLIAIVTDMNHHSGPIAGTFDLFNTCQGRPSFRIDNSKVMMFDERDLEMILGPDENRVKNWAAALKKLQAGEK